MRDFDVVVASDDGKAYPVNPFFLTQEFFIPIRGFNKITAVIQKASL